MIYRRGSIPNPTNTTSRQQRQQSDTSAIAAVASNIPAATAAADLFRAQRQLAEQESAGVTPGSAAAAAADLFRIQTQIAQQEAAEAAATASAELLRVQRQLDQQEAEATAAAASAASGLLRLQSQSGAQESSSIASTAAAFSGLNSSISGDNNSSSQEAENNNYNLNNLLDRGFIQFDENEARNSAINAMNEYLKRKNLILQSAADLSDSVGKILNSKLKFSMIEESPLLKQLYLSDAFISYEKVINNNTLEKISNIAINLEFLDGIKNNDPQSYSDNFHILAQENNVNKNNTLRICLPSNGSENFLIKTFEYTYQELKILIKLILSYSYNLNIPYDGNFSKKIFLYEVNEVNEVIGRASFEFGNRTININKNILAIF